MHTGNNAHRTMKGHLMSTHYRFDTLIDEVFANKGGTYYLANIRGGKTVIGSAGFSSGYYVATENNEAVVTPEAFDAFDLKTILSEYIADKASLLIDNSLYLGFWIADSGRLYIDITEYVSDFGLAIELGRERKQLAIWDIANADEIDLRL